MKLEELEWIVGEWIVGDRTNRVYHKLPNGTQLSIYADVRTGIYDIYHDPADAALDTAPRAEPIHEWFGVEALTAQAIVFHLFDTQRGNS